MRKRLRSSAEREESPWKGAGAERKSRMKRKERMDGAVQTQASAG